MIEQWTYRLAKESPFEYVYPPFLDHLEPLEIEPAMIKGNILVIGQAGTFPEKTLICTPESGFAKFRPGVHSVFCCDTTYPSSPKPHLEHPCINTVFYDVVPTPEAGTAYFELSSCYIFLERVPPDFF